MRSVDRQTGDGDGHGGGIEVASEAFMSNVGGAVQHAADLNAAIGTGFSMDYEGAQQLLTFVTGMQTAVRKVIGRSHVLSQEPQLGLTPAAKVYGPYLPTIATDPDQGFVPVMTKLQSQLDQAATNIQGSLTEYEQNEQGVTGSLVSIHPVETV